jgi:hypothetical protein
MSLFDSIATLFYPTDAAVAQGKALDAALVAKNADYQPGGRIYSNIAATQGTGAANAAFGKVLADEQSGSTLNLIATGDANYDATHGGTGSGSPGWGSVFGDVAILALAGAGVWAFFKFGGVAWLKGKSGKVKWLPWAAVGGVLVLGLFLYSKVKQTASDAGTAANNSFVNPLKTIFS